jgi:hypothetical protein
MLYAYAMFNYQKMPPPEEYSETDKQKATEILSIMMLRLRDGKTRGVKKSGVLNAMVKELISAAKQEGGFPDSDDEDDDEDEKGTRSAKQEKIIVTSGDNALPVAGAGGVVSTISTISAAAIVPGNSPIGGSISRDADSDDEEERVVATEIENNNNYRSNTAMAFPMTDENDVDARKKAAVIRRRSQKIADVPKGPRRLDLFTKYVVLIINTARYYGDNAYEATLLWYY